MKTIRRIDIHFEWLDRQTFLSICLAVLGYCLVVFASIYYFVRPVGYAVIWPAGGVILATLLRLKKKHWPVYLSIVFGIFLFFSLALNSSILMALGITVVHFLGPVIIASITLYLLNNEIQFEQIRQIGIFILVATLGSLISASFGFLLPFKLLGPRFTPELLLWWWSDLTGILVVTPLILYWKSLVNEIKPHPFRRLLEAAFLVSALIGLSWITFIRGDLLTNSWLLLYLTFPLLIWATMRFGIGGASFALLILAGFSLPMVALGRGYFHGLAGEFRIHVLANQFLIYIASITCYFLAAGLAEQRQARRQETETENIFKLFMNAINHYVLLLDQEGRIIFSNKVVSERLNKPQEETKGLKIFELLEGASVQNRLEKFEQVLQTRQPVEFEDERLGRYFHLYYYPVVDPLNEDVKVAVIGMDLTELKLAERAIQASEEKYRNIIAFASDGIVLVDEKATVIEWNRAFELVTGLEATEIQGRKIWQVMREVASNGRDKTNRFAEIEQRIINALKTKDMAIVGSNFEVRLDRKDKTTAIVDIQLFPVKTGDGFCIGAVLHDITQIKSNESELIFQRRRFEQLFENTPIGIIQVDNLDRIEMVNPAFTTIFQYYPEEVVGKIVNEVIVPESMEVEASSITSQALSGSVVSRESVRRRKDGELIPVQIYAIPLNMAGKTVGAYGLYIDISQRKQAEDQLKYLSLHDSLTGLHNRYYFDDEMERLEHSRLFPISVIMADVDGMKRINDTRGHDAGDNLLRSVGYVLRSSFRSEDILARIGGDEFAVLLPETNAKAASEALRRVRDFLEKYNEETQTYPIGLSMGLATANQDQPLRDVLKMADQRMYQEKTEKYRRNPAEADR